MHARASSNVSNVSAVQEEQQRRFGSNAAGAEESIRSNLLNRVAEQALAALAPADITAEVGGRSPGLREP